MSKSLFSGHFLAVRLPELPEWNEDAGDVYSRVETAWRQAELHGANWNEAQTEEELIKPLLTLLGWSYIVQAKKGKGARLQRPDYALFLNAQAKDAAHPFLKSDDAFYARVAVIAEAKHWLRPLDKQTSDGQSEWKAANNPSHQMLAYLVGTRVPWGILTNGIEWRLYSREASSTAGEIYTVRLDEVFGDNGLAPDERLRRFKYWWLFFRSAAFAVDAQGQSFVTRVQEGSATYAAKISDKLKEIVFEDVMPAIAGGFVAYRYRQGAEPETEESLRTIYRASLSLLYKLLFLLYGEARNLLPMDNSGYREQSLTATAQWAAEKIDRQLPISTSLSATGRYAGLLALFNRVDQGDASLAIPRYDGGLFDPSNPDNQFLAQHRLSDRAVATAVDLLVRDKGEPVDYAFLSVYNLGAIYEGLLENRLQVVDGEKGEVVLINDKGERKASGSYYTPDYIVSYIVRHTLGPILDERAVEFVQAMQEVALLRKEAERPNPPMQVISERLAVSAKRAREAFLSIKVCDSAMGSGHFLVNAVDFLTDGIIERIQAYHNAHPDVPATWNPIYILIERVRNEIVAEMSRQKIAIDAQKLGDTALLMRLVMKRCIYGVDLNPMAVELAKLSLWLHSFTVGAPLSFLDHHLRCGNSLIGTDVRTVERELRATTQTKALSKQAKRLAQGRGEQARAAATGVAFTLFGGPFAGLLDLTKVMVEIAEASDSTLADVQQSAELYHQLQASLTPYREALDLWVSRHFDNAGAGEFMRLYGDDVVKALRDGQVIGPPYQAVIDRSRGLSGEKRFFHWDLEFPEVFIDLEHRDWAENPGFDAVIGNPPYENAWSMTLLSPSARLAVEKLSGEASLLQGHWDIFAAFVIRSLLGTKFGGYHSYIVPDAFAREKYAAALRKYILENTKLLQIMHFEGTNVFDEVSRHCMIYVINKMPPTVDSQTEVVSPITIEHTTSRQAVVAQARWTKNHDSQIRVQHSNDRVQTVIDHMQRGSIMAGQYLYVMVGATTHSRDKQSFTKASIVSYSPTGNAKRFFDGKNLARYEINWDGRYLDYRREEMYGPRVPELFESPKIVVRDVTGANERLIVSYDEQQLYCDHLVTCATYYENVASTKAQALFEGYERLSPPYPSLLYTTAILASTLMSWYFRNMFATGTLQGSYSHTYPQQIRAFPIKYPVLDNWQDDRAAAVGMAMTMYENCVSKSNMAELLSYIESLSSPSGFAVSVLHDLLTVLANEMVEANKKKQTEIRSFLAWLQLQLGASISDLTGKSVLQNYLGDYQKQEPHLDLAGLLDILGKNRRRVKVDPLSRAFTEALKREYTASLDKLLPIKRKLAATDALIDQIVYRLYGLNEEEIALVEGKQ